MKSGLEISISSRSNSEGWWRMKSIEKTKEIMASDVRENKKLPKYLVVMSKFNLQLT
jgi:hypothetical protein